MAALVLRTHVGDGSSRNAGGLIRCGASGHLSRRVARPHTLPGKWHRRLSAIAASGTVQLRAIAVRMVW